MVTEDEVFMTLAASAAMRLTIEFSRCLDEIDAETNSASFRKAAIEFSVRWRDALPPIEARLIAKREFVHGVSQTAKDLCAELERLIVELKRNFISAIEYFATNWWEGFAAKRNARYDYISLSAKLSKQRLGECQDLRARFEDWIDRVLQGFPTIESVVLR